MTDQVNSKTDQVSEQVSDQVDFEPVCCCKKLLRAQEENAKLKDIIENKLEKENITDTAVLYLKSKIEDMNGLNYRLGKMLEVTNKSLFKALDQQEELAKKLTEQEDENAKLKEELKAYKGEE